MQTLMYYNDTLDEPSTSDYVDFRCHGDWLTKQHMNAETSHVPPANISLSTFEIGTLSLQNPFLPSEPLILEDSLDPPILFVLQSPL